MGAGGGHTLSGGCLVCVKRQMSQNLIHRVKHPPRVANKVSEGSMERLGVHGMSPACAMVG